MDQWQRRIERAGELARRYPVSAELMYFYRDIARFQAGVRGQDVAPIRALIQRNPADPLAAFYSRVLMEAHEVCRPALAVWREAGRFLLCGGCFAETAAGVGCPACGGGSLRIHAGGEFAHIRVEACDACGAYLKAVDLTLDEAAIPEVDELAAVPLDLWATAQGYRKVNVNLFGL